MRKPAASERLHTLSPQITLYPIFCNKSSRIFQFSAKIFVIVYKVYMFVISLVGMFGKIFHNGKIAEVLFVLRECTRKLKSAPTRVLCVGVPDSCGEIDVLATLVCTHKLKSTSTRVLRVGVPDSCREIDVLATRVCTHKLKSASTRVLRVEALDWSG